MEYEKHYMDTRFFFILLNSSNQQSQDRHPPLVQGLNEL